MVYYSPKITPPEFEPGSELTIPRTERTSVLCVIHNGAGYNEFIIRYIKQCIAILIEMLAITSDKSRSPYVYF